MDLNLLPNTTSHDPSTYFDDLHRMRPVDAIEFTLRTENVAIEADRLITAVKGMILEESFAQKDLELVVKANADRLFLTSDGIVQLKPERLADRVGFFQEQLWELRNALRIMPSADTHWLELALVYAIATRAKGTTPLIATKGEGIWPLLSALSKEFPELERHLELTLENGGRLVTVRAQGALLCMAAAALTPLEHVQMMRSVLSRDGHMGQFCTPWSVADLMSRLLGEGTDEVFDPAADASVLPAVLANNAGHVVSGTGVFMNRFAQYFTTLQVRVLGCNLITWLNADGAELNANDKQYKRCISAPPFGSKVREDEGMRPNMGFEIAINQIVKRLAPSGRAVILVPEGMLFSTARSALRTRILDQHLLKAVISLPTGTFLPYSGVKTSILVLDRTLPPGSDVRFVDAGLHGVATPKKGTALDVEEIFQAYTSTYPRAGVLNVKQSEVRSDEHVSWTMSRFVSQMQLTNIVADAQGIKVVELGSVLHDDILSLGEVSGLPLFQVTELSAELLDMVRTASSGQPEPVLAKKGSRRLDVPALLVARVGGRLKPTIFDPKDGPVTVGANVFMFRVDPDRADPEYLATELRSPVVQDQLDAYHQGTTIPSIAKSDLLRLRLRLPSLPEQRRIVRERKEAILVAQREEIARQEAKHGLSVGEWQILGAVEHSFRPVLALVEQPMKEISALLLSMDHAQREPIESALKKMDSGLDRMRGLFKLINEVVRSEKTNMRVVPVDLRRLFRTELRALGTQVKGMQVYFRPEAGLESDDGVVAHVDPTQFGLVVQNIFTNVAKHAKHKEGENTVVLVRIGNRTEKGHTSLVITVENNGLPFPDGFTHEQLVTFGRRTDPRNGNGIGGFLVDRIIANHGGRFTSGNLVVGDEAAREDLTFEERIDPFAHPRDWQIAAVHMKVQFTIQLPIVNETAYA